VVHACPQTTQLQSEFICSAVKLASVPGHSFVGPRINNLDDDDAFDELAEDLGASEHDSTAEISLSLSLEPLAEREEAE
jgi:hypothetical protein